MLTLSNQTANFWDNLLAIANHHTIEKMGQGLRVESTRPSSNYQREIFIPLLGAQGDTREPEHVENIAVGEFVLQRETQDIKLFERGFPIQARKGASR